MTGGRRLPGRRIRNGRAAVAVDELETHPLARLKQPKDRVSFSWPEDTDQIGLIIRVEVNARLRAIHRRAFRYWTFQDLHTYAVPAYQIIREGRQQQPLPSSEGRIEFPDALLFRC